MKWKNLLIQAVISPFRRRKSSYSQSVARKFLIVSTTGLGDTLWGTPAIRALKRSLPDASISVFASSIAKEVLKGNPHIDRLFSPKKFTFFSLILPFLSMRKQKFDAILVFHTSQRIVLPLCALLKPSYLIGTYGINKDLDFLFSETLTPKKEHEIERRLRIVEKMGAYVNDFHLEIPTEKGGEAKALHLLHQHGIYPHIPLILLHPGARNPFKRWPSSHFIELGIRLANHLGSQIFVTGDQHEAPLAQKIASHIPEAISVAGILDLSTLTALLKRATLFITNDTGPMHLAFAAKTPTIALFGPTDPLVCGPFHVDKVQVLSTQKTCTPCLEKKCNIPLCLYQIGVDIAYDSALSLICPFSAVE